MHLRREVVTVRWVLIKAIEQCAFPFPFRRKQRQPNQALDDLFRASPLLSNAISVWIESPIVTQLGRIRIHIRITQNSKRFIIKGHRPFSPSVTRCFIELIHWFCDKKNTTKLTETTSWLSPPVFCLATKIIEINFEINSHKGTRTGVRMPTETDA